jgi:hypothetical protein
VALTGTIFTRTGTTVSTGATTGGIFTMTGATLGATAAICGTTFATGIMPMLAASGATCDGMRVI